MGAHSGDSTVSLNMATLITSAYCSSPLGWRAAASASIFFCKNRRIREKRKGRERKKRKKVRGARCSHIIHIRVWREHLITCITSLTRRSSSFFFFNSSLSRLLISRSCSFFASFSFRTFSANSSCSCRRFSCAAKRSST